VSLVHDLVGELAKLGTQPMITWVDEAGYPASARIALGDVSDDGVTVAMPAGVRFVAGRANVMGHFHNERMWDLESVLFRGRLEGEGGVWRFVPERQVGKVGRGPRDMIRVISEARRTAQRYLDKRGLPRPAVPWRQIQALKKRARELGID
jgi:hypothetical protein